MDVESGKTGSEPARRTEPAPASSSPSSKEVVTTLGPDTEIEGTLKFRHTLKMQGKFKGGISTEGHVIVGKSGEAHAEIRAGSLVIEGKVTGNIKADDIVDLRSTAQMHGNITASKLKVEDGVVLIGDIDVMPKQSRGTQQKPTS